MLHANSHVQNSPTPIWFGFLYIIGFAALIFLSLFCSLILFTQLFFISQPLGWAFVSLWIIFFLFTLALLHMRYVHPIHTVFSFFVWARANPQPSAVVQQSECIVESSDLLITDQVIAALERPFQHVGVRTENHRQAIEQAISSLGCRSDLNKQAFSDCLQQLLQAAKQNWTDLAIFSPREREVLELLLQDISYKEMSNRLHVSISTIKTHIYHIFQKLDISNREEATQLIHQRGWFSLSTYEAQPVNKR